jgi:acetylornithine deacetylase/succinyl-diaminopimelate desuccinylase
MVAGINPAAQLGQTKDLFMGVQTGSIEMAKMPASFAGEWIPEEKVQQVFEEIYDIFDKLKREDPRFKAKLTRDPANMLTMTHVPNVVSTSHPLVKSLERSVRSVTGKPPKVTSFWGWTDAALMTHFAKMPTVVFGPGGAGAHARIEYVLTEDLLRCTHVYSQVALDICGASS